MATVANIFIGGVIELVQIKFGLRQNLGLNFGKDQDNQSITQKIFNMRSTTTSTTGSIESRAMMPRLLAGIWKVKLR